MQWHLDAYQEFTKLGKSAHGYTRFGRHRLGFSNSVVRAYKRTYLQVRYLHCLNDRKDGMCCGAAYQTLGTLCWTE